MAPRPTLGADANVAQWGRSNDVREALLLPPGQVKTFPLASLAGRQWSPEEVLDFTLGVRVDPNDRYTTLSKRSPFRVIVDVGNGATAQRHTFIPRLTGEVRHFCGSSVRAQLEVTTGIISDVTTDHLRVFSDIAKGRPSPWLEVQYPEVDFSSGDPEVVHAQSVPAWAETLEPLIALDEGVGGFVPCDFWMYGPEGGPIGALVPAAAIPEGQGFALAPWCRAVEIEVPNLAALQLNWRGRR